MTEARRSPVFTACALRFATVAPSDVHTRDPKDAKALLDKLSV